MLSAKFLLPDVKLDGIGPLHEQIKRAVAELIMSGAWPPGTRVPPEQHLMAVLGTSRMTVHRALVSLAEEGLIQRRRRIGTIVLPLPVSHPMLAIPDIQDVIAASGREHSMEVISRTHFPDGAAMLRPKFGAICDRAVLHLVCRHFASRLPFVIEDRVIALDMAPGALEQDFGLRPSGSWLLDTISWTDAEHEISAIALDVSTARMLQRKPGQPALQLMRRTWNGPHPVTVVLLVYPGTNHVFVGRISSYGQKTRGRFDPMAD